MSYRIFEEHLTTTRLFCHCLNWFQECPFEPFRKRIMLQNFQYSIGKFNRSIFYVLSSNIREKPFQVNLVFLRTPSVLNYDEPWLLPRTKVPISSFFH